MVPKYKINVEVVLKNRNLQYRDGYLFENSLNFFKNHQITPGTVITTFEDETYLQKQVICIIIEEIPNYPDKFINFSNVEIKWIVYGINETKPQIQNDFDHDCEGEINIATHLQLPNADLLTSWENLHYENDIKSNLLKYAETIMKFSDSGVDENIISCNKVILLHGPPGTGKTSLCKALAHKLSAIMQEKYDSGLLIEINSHSLFSKYFSESGKLVSKMFSNINRIVENEEILVFVLIDEIESLAHARDQCLAGVEPSDSIRVVNAVLTQIDQIKQHRNVLILATSNLTKSIDLAFIDRADIKQYLGLPSTFVIYKIYLSCIKELQRVKFLNDIEFENLPKNTNSMENLNGASKKLVEICEMSAGLSGRSFRKIPFIAYSLFVDKKNCDVFEFLDALKKAVDKEKNDRMNF